MLLHSRTTSLASHTSATTIKMVRFCINEIYLFIYFLCVDFPISSSKLFIGFKGIRPWNLVEFLRVCNACICFYFFFFSENILFNESLLGKGGIWLDNLDFKWPCDLWWHIEYRNFPLPTWYSNFYTWAFFCGATER